MEGLGGRLRGYTVQSREKNLIVRGQRSGSANWTWRGFCVLPNDAAAGSKRAVTGVLNASTEGQTL